MRTAPTRCTETAPPISVELRPFFAWGLNEGTHLFVHTCPTQDTHGNDDESIFGGLNHRGTTFALPCFFLTRRSMGFRIGCIPHSRREFSGRQRWIETSDVGTAWSNIPRGRALVTTLYGTPLPDGVAFKADHLLSSARSNTLLSWALEVSVASVAAPESESRGRRHNSLKQHSETKPSSQSQNT